MVEPITIQANGKLMITGEYFVLDGAIALAVPTKFGQSFSFVPVDDPSILWKGLDSLGNCWLEESIALPLTNEQLPVSSPKGRLLQVLRSAYALNPQVFKSGWQVTSKLDFPRDWGLGSSSTMIYAVAKWAGVDPYTLLRATFGGSGYDIACAGANQAILYTVESQGQPANWHPVFSDQLYFVHLNQKQNSREGIQHYRTAEFDRVAVCMELDELTNALLECHKLLAFEDLLKQHELMVGTALGLPLVKEKLFSDYWGAVKSLGAWGGDFVLVTSNRNKEETVGYFKENGYETVLCWQEMVLS